MSDFECDQLSRLKYRENCLNDVRRDISSGKKLSETMQECKFVGYLALYAALYLEEKGVI